MSFHRRMAIVGGLGPHAGAYALQNLLEQAAEDYGCYHDHEYPDVILHSVPFDGSNPTGIEDPSVVVVQLQDCLHQLQSCDVALALLACNSSHAFLDPLQAGTGVEIISLIKAAHAEIAAHPARRFGILASRSTRHACLYERVLAEEGRGIVDTAGAFQQRVDTLIAEAMRPRISAACLGMFETLVAELHEAGAEAVILGCTEISRLRELVPLPVPVIDSLEAATRQMLKKSYNPKVLGEENAGLSASLCW